MSLRYEHCEIIRATPEAVFAVIDDLPQTAKWLPPCVSLEKVGEGVNAVGDQLHYAYRQGSNQGTMAGEILARVPDQRLYCKYTDKMFEVGVDLLVNADSAGCMSTHIINITPKTWVGKLMSPLIRVGLKKQTRDAAANLRRLLEST